MRAALGSVRVAVGFVEQQRLTICEARAGQSKPDFLEHVPRGEMIGIDHGDDAIDPQGTKCLLHHHARRLGPEPAPPDARMEVVAELDLRPAMLCR